MHLKKIIFVALILFGGFAANAQTKRQARQVERLFKERGEIHFRFILRNKSDQKELTRRISIDHVHGDTVWAFASKRGMLGFFEMGYSKFKLLDSPSEAYKKSLKQKPKGGKSTAVFDNYPTYGQYEQIMQQFESSFPSICKLVNLGTLPSGRKILALRISDSVNKKEPEPQFLYTSTIHGDETAGYPMMLKLADYLLTGYGSDFRATSLVNNMEIWLNPLANPDGTYRGGNNSVSNAVRFNANNVDLNRNFPDPEDGIHPDGNTHQPETKIFMAFADTMDFVMAANFHGGTEVANFPWDTWQKAHADEQWWIGECVRYVDSTKAHAPSTYFNEILGYPSIPGVVRGFDWYEVNGGRQDYMNWFHNCREMTVELSDEKLLPENQLENHWQYNKEGLLNFMEAALFGIRGTVTDICTGKPLKARVFITVHDKDSSHVYSTSAFGNYYRPIAAGTYSVEFSAKGYETLTLSNVQVQNTLATILNIGLQPKVPVPDFSISKPDLCSPVVNFSDKTGSANTWKWYFGDGDSSVLKNPMHQYSGPGPFSVRLKVSNCVGSGEITKTDFIFNSSVKAPVLVGDTSNCGAKIHSLKAMQTSKVEWFTNPNGGIPVDTNLIFNTMPLNQTTTFYAQSISEIPNQFVGPVTNTIGSGGYFSASTYHYLMFDTQKEFVLKSVRVYAATSGNRTIQLRNSQEQVLKSVVVFIPAGNQRVDLNIMVPVGEGFQLGIAGGNSNNLFRNQLGANYPYQIPGLLSINGNSAGNPAIYYFFYDWEVGSKCQSIRVPVVALVQNAPNPTAIISPVNSPVCQGDTAIYQVNFSNGGTQPQFSWFVGANLVSNSQVFKTTQLTSGATITCRVLSSDSCAVNNPITSNQSVANILPLPNPPVLSLNGGVLQSSVLSGNQWYLNGNLIQGASGNSYVPALVGSYTVRVLGSNGCLSGSSDPVIITGVSLNSKKGQLLISFRNEVLSIENQGDKVETIEIYNSLGQTLVSQTIKPGTEQILTQSWPAGRYFIRSSESQNIQSFVK